MRLEKLRKDGVNMAKDKVYLYSRYRGRFDVYEGDLRSSNYGRGRYYQFIFKRNGKESCLQCSGESGVVHHSVLWLPERNDQLARDLFIEHERTIIKELQDKIEHHEWNIKQIMDLAK